MRNSVMETYNVHNLETKVRFLLPHPGGLMSEDFEKAYMAYSKKELVKIIKRKVTECAKYTNLWREEVEQNDRLMSLLDDYNDKLENGCCKK